MNLRSKTCQILPRVVGVAVMLTACSLPGASSVAPSIFGTPVPSPTPTSTPTPLPTPTPTPVPAQVVSQGERELLNGDWNAALTFFQQVAADPAADEAARGSASFGVAEASLRMGDFAGASHSFDAFLVAYSSHPLVPQAYFLRGDARLGLSDWAGAVSDYQLYLSLKPGLIDSYVYERIADAELAQGQSDSAFQSYDAAIAADRFFVSGLQLREKVASIYRAVGQTDKAIDQYNAILGVAQNSAYRATIEFDIGQALFEGGRTDEAYKQFDHVFMTYPTAYEAWGSLKALRDANIEVDQYQRGIVNFNQGNDDVSVEAFLNYWAATKPQQYTPESYLYVARSYRRLGNAPSALTLLHVYQSRFGPQDGQTWGDSFLEMALDYTALGDNANALLTYDNFVKTYPSLPQAADALYEAGNLAQIAGNSDKATAYYQQLAAAFPADPRASRALFDQGVAAFNAGNLSSAQALFQSASQLAANERPAATYYWLGKTLTAAGDAANAGAALDQAAPADGPLGYYTVRKTELLSGASPFAPPVSVNFPADWDEGRADAEQWLVQRLSLTGTPPLAAALRADIASDPRFTRASELWQLGMPEEARPDFEAIRQQFQDDPVATYQLAIHFRDIGLYRSSIIAAGRLLLLAQVTPYQAPPFLARLRYPTYFSELVMASSASYSLDPLLVYSLIWQESTFEGFATSSASAQGLMQIWPPTGQDIANALSWPGYTPADLRRPYVSVAFGTWLMQDELHRFDGDRYAMLAAYNAGPGRAADWRTAAQGDPDRFLESVTLNEPKVYIQRIVELYAIYSALYGSRG